MKNMPQNMPDRRVQKTRKLLQDALIELVERRRLALSVPRFPLPAPSLQRQRGAFRRDPAHWLDVALARAPIGKRHDGAFFLACRLLQDAELSPAQAESWMRSYAERVPQNEAEPYPVNDALNCLRWVATYLL